MLPGSPDGWTIALPTRVERDHRARIAIGVVLAVLIAFAVAIEPVFAVLPAFGVLALGAMWMFEETGPGADAMQFLHIGSAGVRIEADGDVVQSVPASGLRDVFWRSTVGGEKQLGVRGPAGEHLLVSVPTNPPFRNGMSDEQREWVAQVIRTVGRRSQGRAGTEADVPDALTAMQSKEARQPEGKGG